MSLNIADLADLIIANAASTSNAISIIDDAYGLSIQAPATLTASQVQIQTAVSSGASASFVNLQSGGSDIVLAAGKGLIISPIPWRQLRLISSSAEGAARTFSVAKVVII